MAGVLILILIAVPLYVMRSPGPGAKGRPPATAGTVVPPALIRSNADAGADKTDVTLSTPQRIRCSSAPNRPGNEGSLCDRLVVLEEALARAIRSTTECAPKTGKEGTINFVLTIDFTQKRLNVFPGASGVWKGPQAKVAAQCVAGAMPELQWESIPHRYRYYMLSILASYSAPDPLEGLPSFD